MPDFTATVADAFSRAAKDGSHSVTIKLAFPKEIMDTAFHKYDGKIKDLVKLYAEPDNGVSKILIVDWESFTFK